MQYSFIRVAVLACAAAGALVACAPPPPEPIQPEPVFYDKYGNPSGGGGECRPTGERVNSAYPASVPDCPPPPCPPGQSSVASTAYSPVMCVPNDDGGRDPGTPGREPDPQDPTGSSARG